MRFLLFILLFFSLIVKAEVDIDEATCVEAGFPGVFQKDLCQPIEKIKSPCKNDFKYCAPALYGDNTCVQGKQNSNTLCLKAYKAKLKKQKSTKGLSHLHAARLLTKEAEIKRFDQLYQLAQLLCIDEDRNPKNQETCQSLGGWPNLEEEDLDWPMAGTWLAEVNGQLTELEGDDQLIEDLFFINRDLEGHQATYWLTRRDDPHAELVEEADSSPNRTFNAPEKKVTIKKESLDKQVYDDICQYKELVKTNDIMAIVKLITDFDQYFFGDKIKDKKIQVNVFCILKGWYESQEPLDIDKLSELYLKAPEVDGQICVEKSE